MIEKMKKLTLLIYHSSKNKFLSNLQELGVVHLETNPAAYSENINKTKDIINRLGKAYRALIKYQKTTSAYNPSEEIGNNVFKFLSHFEDTKNALDIALNEKEQLRKDYAAAIPFGNFNKKEMEELAAAGIQVKFYSASKSVYSKLDLSSYATEIIFTDKSTIYFAVFYTDTAPEIQATEEKLPLQNVKEIMERESGLNLAVADCEKKFAYYATLIPFIEKEVLNYHNILHYEMADASLASEVDGKVFIITGFVPSKAAGKVKDTLEKEDCAFLLENPSQDDVVPIRLRNNPYAKLFEPIGLLFSLPNYNELDSVPFFAPFFALFFGLCLGDLGYGAVMVVAMIIALFAIKNKSLKKILVLGLVLGLFTVLGGFMLNTFFGSSIVEASADGQVVAKISVFESLKNLVTFNNPNDRTGPMVFAILLGIVQVFFGQILNAVNRVRNLGVEGIFQPIGTNLILLGSVIMIMLWMYKPTPENPFTNFNVGPIPLGTWIMALGNPWLVGEIFAGVGVLLVLLFNNIGGISKFLRPLAGLWELYSVTTGLLGDILSYIRIFALGLAGGLLGSAFNGIALQVKEVPFVGIILMLVIMLLGHTLNFMLAALGAFVHPLRLTFVEFYKAIGFTGGGKPYTPFNNRTIEK